MPTLRTRLARLEQPVEVDRVAREVADARGAVLQRRDALLGCLGGAPVELGEAVEDLRRRSEQVARIDEQTSSGLLGTLLSSTDERGVEATRARAAASLSGALTVLEHRIEQTRGWVDGLSAWRQDAEYGGRVLRALSERARRGGLDVGIVRQIDDAAEAVEGAAVGLPRAAGAVEEPLVRAEAAAAEAAGVLSRLRSGARAATVGEALLDKVVPGEGAVGRALRRKVAAAAPDLVPDPERRAGDLARVEAEIEGERESARARARRDADAVRRAMEELDALDDG